MAVHTKNTKSLHLTTNQLENMQSNSFRSYSLVMRYKRITLKGRYSYLGKLFAGGFTMPSFQVMTQ